MDPIALLASLCVMGAIILALVAFYRATASPRAGMERRLGRVMGDSVGDDMQAAAALQGLRRSRKTSLPLIGLLGEGRSWTAQANQDLERADLRLTVSEFVAIRIVLAAFLAIMPVLLLGGAVAVLAAFGLGFVGFSIPKFWVSRRKSSRLAKLDSQLPDMLSMVSNSLKAGFGLMQSLDLASRELAHPISTEIRRLLQDINVGMTTDAALFQFGKRAGSKDLDIVVTAMLIQQSTGGNLAEILETVGTTMRERIRIRGEIKTLTTQQMMTGYVIGGLPVFLALGISMMNPSYIEPLFTTLAGQLMLAGAAVMELFGVLVIKRILAIEV